MDMQQTSGFFKLPAELRNRIYELVVVSNKPLKVWTSLRHALDGRFLYTVRKGRFEVEGEPGICQISRQARSKALNIYYGGNVFEFIAAFWSKEELHDEIR